VGDNGFTYEDGTDLALDTKTGNGINKEITFTDEYIGTIDDGIDLSSVDNFFIQAKYKGAVQESDNWTSGWTKK